MERTESVRDVARATFRLVTEAQQGMSRSFDAARVGVLQVVAARGPVRPGAIGEQLDMAPSSVTRHVQALEDAGQVSVAADPADARTCLITTTPAGLTELDRLEAAGLAVFADVVADWSEADLRTLVRLMRRLTDDWAARGPAAKRANQPKREPRWRFRG
ncbi:MarR family winged helix-turn-helix transcriptional regulator [Actinocrispum wychmicini]|uniref:DNA-binding MarR family transcriptional regulator n=1 Tax=Actinocrispum wychmicini TaxID=1213861 RepID=A0A4R2JCL5_9PSEU|nr:MarR family winged helix-turn-helix transcriptional regulator [Actinocrispum wychmicini]TCO57313.1 DNA-binding MarR family transcriptional regulator [Actinocrispum wychmicini]